MAEKFGFRSVCFARLDPDLNVGPEGKRAIIRNVSFSVKVGEIFVIAGPSGSGKSTLLRLANRLLVPTSGMVLLDGIDIAELEVAKVRRRVGLVQQSPALFDGTVVENVLFGPRLAGANQRGANEASVDDCAAECLEQAGLAKSFLSRDADELSEGEKQRVAIARVLANRPEVLLLDEPTASLDPSSTLTVEKHVRRLKETSQLAILFVTHDVAQATRLGDRGILLVNGQKVDEGPLPKLFQSPNCETTQAFVNGKL